MKLEEDIDRLRMLGKELEHEIPTSQRQYKADYKEMDQEDQCFLYLRRNGPR